MWRLPTKIFIRESGVLQLPEIIQQNIFPTSKQISSALIVTDKSLHENTPWIKSISHTLHSALDCNIQIYDQTPVNPRIETVEQISEIAISHKSDLIISIGGGSCIDAGKASAMYASPTNNKQSLSSFVGKPNLHSPEGQIPFIAIPTTCGTGSEVTWVSVLSDNSIKRKISIKGDSMFPTAAIIDCDLLKTLPRHLIAWTSMDALTHALEAYISNCGNAISDEFAIKAIDMIFEYLPRAVNKIKSDRFARYHIMNASTFAGMAFGNADVGAVHCLSETLGGLYDVEHGLANSAILYSAMKYHQPFIREKLIELSRRIGIEKKMVFNMLAEEYEGGLSALKRVGKDDLFLLCLDRLRSEIGHVLKSFSELGVDENEWESIAKECVLNGSNGSNPQVMDEGNYMELLGMLQEDRINYIKNPCHERDD